MQFAPEGTVLRRGRPESVGLRPEPIVAALATVRAGLSTTPPAYPGAVALLAHRGTVVAREASGHALLYAAADRRLSPGRRVPMSVDTLVDIASLTKIFTAIAVAQLVEEGAVDLGAPVAAYVPEFVAGGKEAVTVRQLLLHTSGLRPDLPLWVDQPDVPSRVRAVLERPLDHEPGSVFAYGDLNFITLGILVERLRGSGLARVVHDRVTAPLGMHQTAFLPPDAGATAATEHQVAPPRGLVHGSVHDEKAWALGGVAGHAGVFSTVDDLAILAQTLLNGGTYRGERILGPGGVRSLVTDHNTGFPGHAHGLGFELDQPRYMGELTGPTTAGHTGFTGTSLVVDLSSQSVAILLTNRVHPSRETPGTNAVRAALADGLARSQRPSSIA